MHEEILRSHDNQMIGMDDFKLRSRELEIRKCTEHPNVVLSFGCIKCLKVFCTDCLHVGDYCKDCEFYMTSYSVQLLFMFRYMYSDIPRSKPAFVNNHAFYLPKVGTGASTIPGSDPNITSTRLQFRKFYMLFTFCCVGMI